MKEMKLDRHEFNLLVNDILLDVKPVKLRISIANRLIEFFDKKQERIAELEQTIKMKQATIDDMCKGNIETQNKILELQEENNHLKTFVWNKDDDDSFRNCKSDNQKFMAYSIAKNLLHSEIEKVKELEKQLVEKDALLKGQLEEIKNLHKRINEIVERDKKIITEQPKQIVEKIKSYIKDRIENEKCFITRDEYDKPIQTMATICSNYTINELFYIIEILDNLLKEYSNEN